MRLQLGAREKIKWKSKSEPRANCGIHKSGRGRYAWVLSLLGTLSTLMEWMVIDFKNGWQNLESRIQRWVVLDDVANSPNKVPKFWQEDRDKCDMASGNACSWLWSRRRGVRIQINQKLWHLDYSKEVPKVELGTRLRKGRHVTAHHWLRLDLTLDGYIRGWSPLNRIRINSMCNKSIHRNATFNPPPPQNQITIVSFISPTLTLLLLKYPSRPFYECLSCLPDFEE